MRIAYRMDFKDWPLLFLCHHDVYAISWASDNEPYYIESQLVLCVSVMWLESMSSSFSLLYFSCYIKNVNAILNFCCLNVFTSILIDQFHNPRMHLFYIPQCSIQNRNVHISVLNGALWDMEQVHSGICELGQIHQNEVINIWLMMNQHLSLLMLATSHNLNQWWLKQAKNSWKHDPTRINYAKGNIQQ